MSYFRPSSYVLAAVACLYIIPPVNITPSSCKFHQTALKSDDGENADDNDLHINNNDEYGREPLRWQQPLKADDREIGDDNAPIILQINVTLLFIYKIFVYHKCNFFFFSFKVMFLDNNILLKSCVWGFV